MPKMQGLRDLHVVTEWKDGCIYRTKHVGYAYVTFGMDKDNGNSMFCSISTSVERLLKPGSTMRTVSDLYPDICKVDIETLKA